MKSSTSPVIVELSSDSENYDGYDSNQRSSGECFSQRDEDVFTLDWADSDYPPAGFDINDFNNEIYNEQKDDISVSSADTEIYAADSNDVVPEEVIKNKGSNQISKDNDETLIYHQSIESDPQAIETCAASERSDVSDSNSDIIIEKSLKKLTEEVFNSTIDNAYTSTKSFSCFKENDKNSQKKKEKILKEQKTLEARRLREEKKEKQLEEKIMKAALAKKHKNMKPEENIKLVTINIDTKIINSEFGGSVIILLQQSGLNYHVADQRKSYTVSWSKKIKDITVRNEGIAEEIVGEKEEDQLLYIIKATDFVKLINDNELTAHIQTIKSLYSGKSLTLVTTGIEKYFKEQKKRGNVETDLNKKKRMGKKSTEFDVNINMTREEVQRALIELQLFNICSHWPVETAEELASLIITTTKSISQLEYKTEKYKNEEENIDFFAKADSKQCAKVDKQGNGLLKLWQQQICQFNTVGIEMASVITSNFHSPLNLVNSYKNCDSKAQAELLLQNLQMRRNAGILSSARRLGPEVSRKIYNFYTSSDPDLEL